MRIAFLTPEFVTEPYFSGGLANYVHRLSRALAAAGHDVHVLVRADRDECAFDFHGLAVHRIAPKSTSRHRDLLGPDAGPDTEAWLGYSEAVSQRLSTLNAEKPFDLAQASNSRGCGLLTALQTTVPLVTRISCYRPLWNTACRIPRTGDVIATERIELQQIKVSRAVFAPSRMLAGIIRQEAGIPHVPVLPTPMYVETASTDHTLFERHLAGRSYLLFVGRYQEHKGFHHLVRALPEVLAEHPHLYAAFVGADAPGMNRPSMAAWAREYLADFTDRTVFLGQTPHTALYPIMQNATLVVLPSLVDNLPNTCLEAMALGRPVLGTHGASFDELITHGENGFLTSPGNVPELAHAMQEALARPDLERIGRAATDTAARFSPENAVTAHLKFYTDSVATTEFTTPDNADASRCAPGLISPTTHSFKDRPV